MIPKNYLKTAIDIKPLKPTKKLYTKNITNHLISADGRVAYAAVCKTADGGSIPSQRSHTILEKIIINL